MSYVKDYRGSSATEVAGMTLNRVYAWMGIALLVSALTAYLTVAIPQVAMFIFGSRVAFFGLIVAEVGLVIYLSARLHRISFTTGFLLFMLYSVLNGATLSSVLMVFQTGTVYTAFLATALTFGAMSLVGATTRRDLSSIGSYLTMALIGLIIATVVNLFLHNSGLEMILTYVGLFIFIGLTAWDTQRIKRMLSAQGAYGIDVRKIALMGALSLYLDFVNLFLYMLRFLDSRR